jgi:lipopolysaccharide biosynthesis glycosyltransferase
LGREFNLQLSAHHRDPVPERGIYHFVGSPKPWDLFGEFFHSYSHIWNEASGGIALRFMQRRAYADFRSWRRLPRIIGGYRRILRQRYKLFQAERARR